MPTTDQDARALTYLAKRLREETHGANRWDEAGIFAVIAKRAGQNLAATIEAVTRHAADATAKTPGAINRPFTPPPPSEQRDRYLPPKRGEDCPRHPGQWATSCGGCEADTRADDEPATPPRAWDAGDAPTGIAACRAALAGAKTEGEDV
ncbi:MAG TPA: hypothetical protein VFJ19_10025 [Nocardioidaceae bacterium]|nr:hypothetical protein [Nocardioidaceae bacterium]